MMMKSAGLGLVVWLILLAVLRFTGESLIDPLDPTRLLVVFVALVPVMVGLLWLTLAWLKPDPAGRVACAGGLALPGLLLGAAAVIFNGQLLPNYWFAQVPVLAAFVMFGSAVLLLAAGFWPGRGR